jgi:AraC-like DNA-binding protein
MQVVFDTKRLAAAQRREAWREAICEIYLQVDCAAEKQDDYAGFVREARLGAVTLTDALCSAQSIHRRPHHTAHFDKDFYYFGIEHLSEINIHQAGSSFPLRPGIGTLYYANEPYNLRCYVKSRQFWVELPRDTFDRRFDSGRPPLLAPISLSEGLGRIAAEFCSSLAQESANVDETPRERLGEQLMDILALALHGEPGRQSADEKSVQLARLGSIKAYIESNLGDPNLSLTTIAKQNGISLRYLHQLFRLTDASVSEWLRLRRLQKCYDLLMSPQHANQTITEVAYSMGFNSSSHFSNLFRAQFNVRPSDVRGASVGPSHIVAPRWRRAVSSDRIEGRKSVRSRSREGVAPMAFKAGALLPRERQGCIECISAPRRRP